MSYYIEKPNIGLEEIYLFVKYMIENRTASYLASDIFKENSISDDYLIHQMYKPLEKGQDLPDILFTKSGSGNEYPDNYQIKLLPSILTRFETNVNSYQTGKVMTPIVNLENILESYYNKGLSEGNHHYLHHFAIKFNYVIEEGMQVITGIKENGVRFFLLSNPNCEDPKFYYN